MHSLDGDAFIYPALYEGSKASGAAALLASVVAGDVAAATASPTLDEVIWIVPRDASREVALEQGERLLHMPNLRVLDVGSRELLRAVELIRTYDHLTPRDAIHLSAAIENGIHSVVSDAEAFDDVIGVERVGLGGLDVPCSDSV